MTTAITIILAVLSSSAVAALITLLLDRRRAVWTTKQDACMAALSVIDGLFANTEWVQDAGRPFLPTPQARPAIEEIRRCHNLLAVTCRHSDTIKAYQACFGNNVRPDMIDDVRNAIRKELGIFWRPLELNRDASYIAVVGQAQGATSLSPGIPHLNTPSITAEQG